MARLVALMENGGYVS